ncbi:MAG: helix-turn-helix transcriptional regulator [Clostridia bacterium]|nr:helix-turn-helix transcriptional regulator [Clostridia bacterium]
MTELKSVIAKNICELRIESGMTQLALAEMLNYSDKAISKWERGESVPDVFMLKRIADIFEVTVDYLLEDDHTAAEIKKETQRVVRSRNRVIISMLAMALVWLVGATAFVLMQIFIPTAALRPWLMFIYAIPVTAIVAIVFNSLWGRKKKLNYLIISVLVWGVLLSLHLTLLMLIRVNVWQVYLIGIPGEIITLLWSFMIGKKN